MGKLHGRKSREWNLEDSYIGRKVWYHSFERNVRSSRHYYRSLNYIHHNPVKHGYCSRLTDWKPSSFKSFLSEAGRRHAIEIWKAYPIGDYGDSLEGSSG